MQRMVGRASTESMASEAGAPSMILMILMTATAALMVTPDMLAHLDHPAHLEQPGQLDHRVSRGVSRGGTWARLGTGRSNWRALSSWGSGSIE